MDKAIQITPAYDKRDPRPSRNGGIHGCVLNIAVSGRKGAVAVSIFTGWQLPGLEDTDATSGYLTVTTAVPQYDGQPPDVADGVATYTTASPLAAIPLFTLLRTDGLDAVFDKLEEIYKEKTT